MTRKSVVLLGKGSLAVRIGQWLADSPDWNLMEVIPVIPEPDWTDSLSAWARSRCIPLVESGQYSQTEVQGAFLALSVYYDKIPPAWFLAQYRYALNLHNAPLPKYRGVRPINWALKNGENWHGVTIHRMTPGIDDGPVYIQEHFRIDPLHDEVKDVYNQCLVHGWEMFLELMKEGLDAVEPDPQIEELASYYSEADSARLGDRIGWTRPYPEEGWSQSHG